MGKAAYLVMENGAVFQGESFGTEYEVFGEVVFTTSMLGYIETLTDPAFYGTIVVQSFPLVGNYGVMSEDFESKDVCVKGYVVGEWCQEPSNFRSEGNLDTFLLSAGVSGICGVDTRALTKLIRKVGVMKGKIIFSLGLVDFSAGKYANVVESITVKEVTIHSAENAKYNVAIWDFGIRRSTIKELTDRGCNVTCIPAGFTAEEILSYSPAGIVIAGGPGDPMDNTKAVGEVRKITKTEVPVFGIGLGHQLLALSCGAKTKKMRYGHRGDNQPVKDIESGRVYVTSQNHGYMVDNKQLPQDLMQSFVNVNDGTCEGLCYVNRPMISVQFLPKDTGLQGTGFLFDIFVKLMGVN